MDTIKSFLQGKKSYLIAILVAIFHLSIAFGIFHLTNEQIMSIDGVFAALGLAALKAATATPYTDPVSPVTPQIPTINSSEYIAPEQSQTPQI